MKETTSLNIRIRVEGKIYQATIHHDERNRRVTKPAIIEEEEGSTMYEWSEETTYNTLTVDILKTSMLMADSKNCAKEMKDWIENAETTNLLLKDISTKLTEEDMELINEFLEC